MQRGGQAVWRFRIRFRLREIMGAIAMFAIAGAAVPAEFSARFVALLFVFTIVATVISICTTASWLSVAAWLAAFYPGLVLLSLYVTWLIAWYLLGHPPRIYLDDPNFIHPFVNIFYGL